MTSQKTIPLFLGLFVSLLYMLFYFYDYFLQTSFSILPPDFFAAYHITNFKFGLLSSAFFYGYIIFQLPLGFTLDSIGLKYTAILCALCCVLGTALFYFASSLPVLFLARFIIGAGTACACVMSVYAVSSWLPPRYFSVGVGTVQLTACLGSIFGQAIGSAFIAHFGWEACAQSMIGFGIILLFVYSCIPKHPERFAEKKQTITLKELPKFLVNKQVLTICMLGFIAWTPVSVLAASWMVRFLHQEMNWTHHYAASLIVSFWIGLALSSLFIGQLALWLKSFKQTVLLAFILQGGCGIFLLTNTHYTPIDMVIVLGLLGSAASVQTLSFIMVSKSVPKKGYGAASALVNMISASSGAVINPIFGLLVGETHHYHAALWLFPSLSLIGILLARFGLKDVGFEKKVIINLQSTNAL